MHAESAFRAISSRPLSTCRIFVSNYPPTCVAIRLMMLEMLETVPGKKP